MTELIIAIGEIKLRHLGLCGNKATNLGAIARKSRTAPGFCLTTAAYFQSLDKADLHQELITLAESTANSHPKKLQAISQSAQALLRQVELPEEVERELRSAYEELIKGRKGVAVAVRSSATVEDLPKASFAGQLESYLQRENWPQVREAVLKCWASLWSEPALHYRRQNGLVKEKVGVAVIIQEMVPAQVSGVMFTANPLTHNRREIYIEAVAGLPDQLVQGQAAGEIYTVDKETLTISARQVQGRHPLLVDFSLRQLAHEGKKMEYLFEDYQDVEWAFYQQELFVLQARPITTLAAEKLSFDLPAKATAVQKEIYINIQERFPDPVMPLDTVITKIYYLSLFAAYRELGYAVPLTDWQRVEQGVFPEHFQIPAIKPAWRRPFNLGKMLRGDLMKDWRYNEAAFNKYVQLMQQDMLKNFPMEIVLEYLEDGLKDFQRANTFRYLLYIQYGSMYRLLQRLLQIFYGDEGEALFPDLVVGQPQVTLAMHQTLAAIAHTIQNDRELARLVAAHAPRELPAILAAAPAGGEVLTAFADFLQAHGHREVSQGLGGVGAATWRDRPEVVWGMIKTLAGGQQEPDNKVRLAAERRQQAEAQLASLVGQGWGRLLPLKSVFRRLLDYSRRYTAFREDSHFYLVQATGVFRTLFLAIGKQLAGKGYLKEEKEIMHLTFWEVKELVQALYALQSVSQRQLREKIKARQTAYAARRERWIGRNGPAEMVEAHVWQGVGASHGQITGPCRIIKDPAELHRLKPGDILVAQSTNPSWTPVFSVIGGLVVEYGSALSHAAIIAREYGVPAVMGVSGVTQLLTEGAEVTLDGNKGIIYQTAKQKKLKEMK